MKKCIITLLTLFLIGCFSLPVFANETEFTIRAEEITALKGDTVMVKFSFENNPGIALFTFELDYDKNNLKLKEITGNALMGGNFNDNVDENFLLWMSSSKDSKFNGTVFTAVFEVLPTAKIGKNTVSITLPYGGDGDILNNNYDNIEINIVPGSIDVTGPIETGDINGNGTIDNSDLTNLRHNLLFKNTDYANNTLCDLNYDGKINIVDLFCLKKQLSRV